MHDVVLNALDPEFVRVGARIDGNPAARKRESVGARTFGGYASTDKLHTHLANWLFRPLNWLASCSRSSPPPRRSCIESRLSLRALLKACNCFTLPDPPISSSCRRLDIAFVPKTRCQAGKQLKEMPSVTVKPCNLWLITMCCQNARAANAIGRPCQAHSRLGPSTAPPRASAPAPACTCTHPPQQSLCRSCIPRDIRANSKGILVIVQVGASSTWCSQTPAYRTRPVDPRANTQLAPVR